MRFRALLARVVNNPRSFWLVYVAVAAFLAAMIAATGAFSSRTRAPPLRGHAP